LRARANFVARAEKVRKMNSERPPDNQVSKIAVDGLDHLYASFEYGCCAYRNMTLVCLPLRTLHTCHVGWLLLHTHAQWKDLMLPN